MDKKYYVYIAQCLFIFITIVIVGNTLVYVCKDSQKNSMDFSKEEESSFKQDVSKEERFSLYLQNILYEMTESRYENAYNLLTQESRVNTFGNSIDKFKKVISEKYIGEYSTINVQYGGFDEEYNMYIYHVNLASQPDMSNVPKDVDISFYDPKKILVFAYLDNQGNYSIEFSF